MIFDFHDKNIDLVKHRNIYFFISIAVTVIGILLLFVRGLNLGIDFQSGSRVEIVAKEPLTTEQIMEDFAAIGAGYVPDDVTLAGDHFEMAHARFIGMLSKEEVFEIQSYFKEKYGTEPSISTVSPTVGRELARNALYAVLIASLGILIYITFRFQFLYGVATVISLLHDAFIVLAAFSLLQIEINLPFIAAVLTVVGYSINDTIVTFDRIRENIKLSKRVKTFDDLAKIVNISLLQVMSRSINTVLTVLFCVIAIYLFGGEAIRSFALALLIGLTAGAYSSIFIAAQLWLVMKGKQLEKKKFRSKPKSEEQWT